MATVTLTARYLDQLKAHGKRYEVFDAIRTATGDPRVGVGPQDAHVVLPTPPPDATRRARRLSDVLLEKARKIATQHRGRIAPFFSCAAQNDDVMTSRAALEIT